MNLNLGATSKLEIMATTPIRIPYVPRRMYISLLLFILALSLPFTTFSKSLDEEEFETTVKVSTKLGKVQGIRQTGIDFFGGIPYAAPPVGNLRWAPPEEPASWKPHTLDATHFGPDCWQVIDPLLNPLADPTQMSEDCLYLNIFTPAGLARSRSKLLPVLVWFHGGAFQQGGARRPEYDGRRLAERDMVVVTINYRLGSLGFLVSSPDGILGNFGLMDQRAALYWIQSHIQSFGGDPNKITLFGESAGAVMIGLHLLMHNPGLFHKAVMQSNPVGYRFRSVVVADFLGDALKRGVDCRDLACLRTEPVEEIMRAQSSLMGIPRSVGDFFTWGPVLTNELQLTLGGGDPRLRPGDSLLTNLEHRSLFRVESYQKHRESAKFAVNVSQPLINLKNVPDEIPIIIGTNLHEGEMFVHSAFPITMSKAVYWMFVGALFKDSASRVLKHYRPYVETVERQAQEIAERQIQEEENKQYYTEHREQLEQEYEMLLALNASRNDNRPLMTPEAVESLVRTWHSGGAQDEEEYALKAFGNLTTYKPSWINRIWPWESESETAREERLAMKRRLREIRRKEKQRAKALAEAAKVVVDYRPVMSRIISDYLFRCPSWHYAHSLSHNRVQGGKKNNVYVYRFSQPTHVPGYNECWGKSCHTAELPYVFQAMDIIRTNYSTLSPIAQDEAPSAPEYPYTDMLAAYRGMLANIDVEEEKEEPDAAKKESSQNNTTHTRSFQKILQHFFGDYFVEDADEEIASDMAERWVAFAKTGNPNYDGSKIEWIPWRYIPSDDPPNKKEFEDHMPWEQEEFDLWSDVEVSDDEGEGEPTPDSFNWSDDKEGRAYRRRALEALHMEVVEEDILRTELKRTRSSENDPDHSFALTFLSNIGVRHEDHGDRISRGTIRQVQRIAQDMGVLGTGLSGDSRRSHSQSIWDDDFFPQLLELKWPPEERLVERDCTCDFWERIRYRY